MRSHLWCDVFQIVCLLIASLLFPQDLQTWVNGATENGFVLVSFGAGVKYLPEDIADKLAHALARLPQRVIWR